MPILSGKSIFSSKWVTAEITDSSNRIFYVPIKKTIGDYFLANIEDQVYCFKFVGARVKVYQHTLAKSFRVIQYDLNHYMPISAANNKELEEVIRQNRLPRINGMLFHILKLLGKREKEEFTPHSLSELVNEIGEHEKDYKERVTNIKNYLSHLNISEIVTPVKSISEFIEDDLMTTDSKFMGQIVIQHARTDEEHKKVTNSAITGKTDVIKLSLIIAIIGIIGFAGYWLYDSGFLDGIIPEFPNFSQGGFQPPTPANNIMQQYPTPEALAAAIDRGEVDYNSLPNDVKKLLDAYEPPEVSP